MRMFFTVLAAFISFAVLADIHIESTGLGKPYLVYSEDPFDGSKKYKYMVVPENLDIRCDFVVLQVDMGYFDKYSFPVEIKIRVDGVDFDFDGRYSTHGIISDKAYYQVSKSSDPEKFNALIEAMKAGESAIFGGKASTEWDHETVSLSGFTKAYNILSASCK